MEKESQEYLEAKIAAYEKNITDYKIYEKYRVAIYLLDLIKKYKKLQIKYKNTEQELLTRTEKLTNEIKLNQKIRSLIDNF